MSINYRCVSRAEMEKAMANRVQAGEWERDVYANSKLIRNITAKDIFGI
ncbi:hypothetical protein [Oceanispirochaeta sp. M1]|nr:hypothetical protein [Oceanispirochaeta sp. M1]MBF9018278.1 hypothetical protein [Oceanispirochaeta sp. M2]NPD74743.1 hypothetical protein [Oceanispirochaeta sp. M1]